MHHSHPSFTPSKLLGSICHPTVYTFTHAGTKHKKRHRKWQVALHKGKSQAMQAKLMRPFMEDAGVVWKERQSVPGVHTLVLEDCFISRVPTAQ